MSGNGASTKRPRKGAQPSTNSGGSPLSRSENMSRIRGKNTAPEMAVRRALWAAGLRFRLHDRRLPGRPDIVLAGRKTVVQVHGCFWHCHAGCPNFRLPKTRSEWWAAKLARNVERDANVNAALGAMGWKVLVVWECQCADAEALASLINEVAESPRT